MDVLFVYITARKGDIEGLEGAAREGGCVEGPLMCLILLLGLLFRFGRRRFSAC